MALPQQVWHTVPSWQLVLATMCESSVLPPEWLPHFSGGLIAVLLRRCLHAGMEVFAFVFDYCHTLASGISHDVGLLAVHGTGCQPASKVWPC